MLSIAEKSNVSETQESVNVESIVSSIVQSVVSFGLATVAYSMNMSPVSSPLRLYIRSRYTLSVTALNDVVRFIAHVVEAAGVDVSI